LTESDSENLVSIDRKVRVRDVTVHGDSQFRGVGELFSSSFEVTSSDHDVAGIERTFVVGVGGRREDEGTFNNDCLEDGSAVNVNK